MAYPKKQIHVQAKAKDKLFPYVALDKGEVLWVTKEKTLSTNKDDRAFVSSWEKCEEIIEMIERGEIR